MSTRPPLPPFTRESAIEKVRRAEDGWNTRDPEKVSLAYTVDSRWRNRSEFIRGRDEIVAFLTRKWARELEYRLIKELWAFEGNRIAVRFAYEWHDDSGNWFRSYGNENWEFDENGLMRLRLASINDLPIRELQRKYSLPLGQRPDDLRELDKRTRPAMRDDERQRVLVLGTNVNEVNVQPIDLGDELRQRVQSRLHLAPVVFRPPITREGLNGCELYALRRIRNQFPFRPLGGVDAPAQFGEFRFRNIHMKRTNCILVR